MGVDFFRHAADSNKNAFSRLEVRKLPSQLGERFLLPFDLASEILLFVANDR